MNLASPFHDQLTFGGEILTQPATFLPGELVKTIVSLGIFMSEMKFLPVFRRFSQFTLVNNAMAQPLLNGGCNEMR